MVMKRRLKLLIGFWLAALAVFSKAELQIEITQGADNAVMVAVVPFEWSCLLYTSPSPRDYAASRMPSSA